MLKGCVTRNGKRQAVIVMETRKKRIRSFEHLEVYQNAYEAMRVAYKEIIPKLPKEEDYDLKDQLRRSTKAVPRLIAEGHSKRHQKKSFQKYIDDSMAESNETIVSLSQARDLYPACVDLELSNQLIDTYDKINRQLYNLALSRDKFNRRDRKTNDDSSYATDRR